ncbi:MAG: phosphate ABC transporter substrate-binding protein PstS family protein [Chloroflexota bacterium]
MKTRILAILTILMLALPLGAVLADGHTATVGSIIANSEYHTVLLAAAEAAGLTEALAGEITVFAPTDAAFEEALDALGVDAETLLGATDLLTMLLTYHVVPAAVTSDMLSNGPVTTLEGSPVQVNVSDMGVMVDQASVTAADIVANDGGVVHVVDSVLLTLPNDPAAAAGDIVAAGSSTVFPLAERIQNEYISAGFAGTLTINSIGSGAGFERFCESGETDISNASRAIRDSEIESCEAIGRSPIEFRVGTDALAVTVSADNEFIEEATVEELALIFGEAVNWSDVNADWPNEPIERFIPGTDSGTFDYFVEEVFDEDASAILAPDPTTSENDNVLVEGIQDNPNAIGFFGYAYFAENDDALKALSIDGVEPNAANVDSGDYPLARPLFIYSTAEIMAEKPQVGDFVAYFMSDVSDYVIEVGYFPAAADAIAGAKVEYLRQVVLGTGDM